VTTNTVPGLYSPKFHDCPCQAQLSGLYVVALTPLSWGATVTLITGVDSLVLQFIPTFSLILLEAGCTTPLAAALALDGTASAATAGAGLVSWAAAAATCRRGYQPGRRSWWSEVQLSGPATAVFFRGSPPTAPNKQWTLAGSSTDLITERGELTGGCSPQTGWPRGLQASRAGLHCPLAGSCRRRRQLRARKDGRTSLRLRIKALPRKGALQIADGLHLLATATHLPGSGRQPAGAVELGASPW
jgi:hypothetical protein